MSSIKQWVENAIKQLADAGITSARLDSLLILENALSKSREWILANDETDLEAALIQRLNKKVAKRESRIPLAYIIGSKEFYGRTFFVDSSVLIPRPESEDMIELLSQTLDAGSWKLEDSKTILDVGTGSGCLAVTAKLEFPDTQIMATDISEAALGVARKNALAFHAEITFLKADLLTSIPDLRSSVLLANLPYVPNNLITSEEITKEPALALFSGDDGMEHYRRFWQQVSDLKIKPLHIFTESLENQHPVMDVLAKEADYTLHQTKTLIQHFIPSEK